MKTNIFIILLAAILITSCDLTTLYTQGPTILNIRAYIDGRSQLIIKDNVVYWLHLDFDAPGRWELGEAFQPTYINRVRWEPSWPDIPDLTNDSCNCSSSFFIGIPSLARTNQQVQLDIIRGRGWVTVIQQPNANDNYTLNIEFDDNAFDGADWYEVNITYLVGISL